MREGWEYRNFGDCLNKLPKAKQLQTSEYNSGSKYPIISQEDKLISGYSDDESLLFCIDHPVVVFGDHTRVLKYIDFDFIVGADGVKILSPKSDLGPKFLLYFLKWYNIPNLGYSRHYKLLKELGIPIPPMSEQRKIVAELDKLSELIDLKKKQLEDYDNLSKSLFNEMFGDPVTNEKGWEVKKLGEVGRVQRGSGLSKKDLITEGYPCMLYGQIHTRFGAYTKKHIACIPNELVKIAKIAKPGDVIMAITSEDVEGSCKSVAWLGDYEIAIGSDAAIYRHSQDAIYISYYTQTQAFYYEKSKYARGFKVTHISAKDIENIPIPVPPLSLQQEFAAKIEQIERQKAAIEKQVADLQTLLASRMQYWFDE